MKIDELAAAYGQMVQIRLLEERISTLYADGAIPGFVHTSPDPEACAVGALVHARGSDVITSTRRGRGHVAAKGMEPRRLLAEVIGKQAGACHGRGGPCTWPTPASERRCWAADRRRRCARPSRSGLR